MKLVLYDAGATRVAELQMEGIVIREVQDALDLLANAYYQGAEGIIISEENLTPGFFDLSSGLAGEILQKFSNYKQRLAIIGDFSKYKSKSLKDFILESNKQKRILFLENLEQARQHML